jgi:hypothetical protein
VAETRRLIPNDLKGWDRDMAGLVLRASQLGWTGRISGNNHAIMLAPDGVTTMSVPPKKGGKRAYDNTKADLNRWIKANGLEEEKAVSTTQQKWPCAVPNCPSVFQTMEQLNAHIALKHVAPPPANPIDNLKVNQCPDCDYTHELLRAVNLHRSRVHGYESPDKAARLKRESRRKRDKTPAAHNGVDMFTPTHIMSLGPETMRVRLSSTGETVYAISADGQYDRGMGYTRIWREAGWSFDEIKPTIVDILTALNAGEGVVIYTDEHAVVYTRGTDDKITFEGDDSAGRRTTRISDIEWSDAVAVFTIGDKIW